MLRYAGQPGCCLPPVWPPAFPGASVQSAAAADAPPSRHPGPLSSRLRGCRSRR